MYSEKPTISKEVNAMAEALNTIAQNDFIDSTPINHFIFLFNFLNQS